VFITATYGDQRSLGMELAAGNGATQGPSGDAADGFPVLIETVGASLAGDLSVPEGSPGIVLFAHGSGSGRNSPRNRAVAQFLQQAGLATLLLDLLTEREEIDDAKSGHLRFDIGLLAERLMGAAEWLARGSLTQDLPLGCFGASTGAAAALQCAASRPERIAVVVSRGGRPDLAGAALPFVKVPSLLIVGGNDFAVLRLNKEALARLGAEHKELQIVSGATHLFEEPGALKKVAWLAAGWFNRFLGTHTSASPASAWRTL
jgi:putative phosphoribosyl transferase